MRKWNVLSFAIIVALISSLAYASDVYIEQIGDTATITVTQDSGTGNTVGSSTTSAYINGSANAVDITQSGSSNTADLNVNGGSSTVTTSDVGSSNTTTINIDGGTGTTTTSTITGDSNELNVCKTVDALGGCTDGIAVNDTVQTVVVTGDSNRIDIGVDSTNATNTTTVTGDSNVVTSTQTGVAGVAGHSITLTHVGSMGSIEIDQSGANDQLANIQTAGDSITVNITQGD